MKNFGGQLKKAATSRQWVALSPPPAAANQPLPEPLSAPTFNGIFEQYSRFAWRALVRLGVQSRDAADACQEVFLVVHRRLDAFDASRGSPKSWVYGICVRVASDYRRRHPNRNEVSAAALAQVAVPGEQDDQLQDRRAREKLSRLLDAMDSAKREVFVLYELEALPMTDVASILECPLQTAYARLHAARRLVLAAFAGNEAP